MYIIKQPTDFTFDSTRYFETSVLSILISLVNKVVFMIQIIRRKINVKQSLIRESLSRTFVEICKQDLR
jgi:hypothetical protein